MGGNGATYEVGPNAIGAGGKADVPIDIKKPYYIPPMGIYKVNGQMMEIRVRTGGPIKNISPRNTYAPHIGYYTDVIQTYFALIPNKFSILWRADNNGQLSRNDTNMYNIGP